MSFLVFGKFMFCLFLAALFMNDVRSMITNFPLKLFHNRRHFNAAPKKKKQIKFRQNTKQESKKLISFHKWLFLFHKRIGHDRDEC